MSPFRPKGDRSLRVIVADLAAKADHGTLLTFAALAEAIGAQDDEAGRNQVRQVVSAARPLLLSDHGRALVAVRRQGYRVATPGEMTGVAQDYRARGDESFRKALVVYDKADTKSMTTGELAIFRAASSGFRAMHRRMNAQEDRISDLEEAVYGRRRPVIPGKVEETD